MGDDTLPANASNAAVGAGTPDSPAAAVAGGFQLALTNHVLLCSTPENLCGAPILYPNALLRDIGQIAERYATAGSDVDEPELRTVWDTEPIRYEFGARLQHGTVTLRLTRLASDWFSEPRELLRARCDSRDFIRAVSDMLSLAPDQAAPDPDATGPL